MGANKLYIFLFLFIARICIAQNLPIDYHLGSPEKLEALYARMLKTDSLEVEHAKKISSAAFMAASNYSKIKVIARNLKFANKYKGSVSSQLTDINYINTKLNTYQTNYGVTVIVKFSEKTLADFKTDLTKIFLKLLADGQSPASCIVAEVYGTHTNSGFSNEIGYKLYTLGDYSSLSSLNNYNKNIENPTKSYQKEVFEDLDQVLFQNQEAIEALSAENSSVIGGDLLADAMKSAGLNACAFCKVCSQATPNGQGGSGNVTLGDGFTAPIRLIKNNISYNCVIANYNATNSTVVTSVPSNLNLGSFSNNKIVPKGNQFVILKKTVLNEDEFVTCIATQDYSDYCTSTNPFSSQTFKNKIAIELQSCAQQEDTRKQALLTKYTPFSVKALTYVFEDDYLITKIPNGNIIIKPYSQLEYNKLIQDLKSGKLSNDAAIVYKKTSSGYDVKANYGSNVIVKPGYSMNGTAIDKSEIAFETVMNEFLETKTNLAVPDLQTSSGVFEDSKKIEIKESTVWNKIQDGLSAGREFIEQAKITEKYYNSSNPDYSSNWVNTPPLLSGIGNGVIDEIKEIPQLVFLACDIATKEEVRTSIWNGLKGLDLAKIKKAASSTLNSWTDTYSQGGDVAWHQGGKDGVMVFTLLSPAGLLKNADDALGKNLDDVAEKVRRKGGIPKILTRKPSWMPNRVIEGSLDNPKGLLGVFNKNLPNGSIISDTKNALEDIDFPLASASNFKSLSKDGFKMLNTPGEFYQNSNQFWDQFNKVWLNDLASNKADIIILSDKSNGLLKYTWKKDALTGEAVYDLLPGTNQRIKTGFGREIEFMEDLVSKGKYQWDNINGLYKNIEN